MMSQPKKHFLSLQMRSSILQMLEAGYGYRSIARFFHLSIYTVRNIADIYKRGELRYFGVDTIHYKHSYSLQFKIETVEKYLRSGMPLKTFARENGVCPNTLRVWVNKSKKGELLRIRPLKLKVKSDRQSEMLDL